MSSVPLLYLAPRVTDDSVRVWRAAMDLGWEVLRLPSWRIETVPNASRELVVYAEPLFAEAVADQTGRILFEPPPEWLASVPDKFRLRRTGSCSLATARGLTFPVFIKPAEGKVFEARVYAAPEELPSADQVDPTLAVLWSEPVNFTLEVRCFVSRGSILSMSPYWRDGSLAAGEDFTWPFLDGEERAARNFVKRFLAEHGEHCPPACVIDAGFAEGRGWAVIEANPCWGAGLYGCDPVAALETGRLSLIPRSRMTDDSWRWTSPRVRPAAGLDKSGA